MSKSDPVSRSSPWPWAISLAGLLLVAFLFRDVFLRMGGMITCEDGTRGRIDTREFETKYWVYNVQLEATLSDKQKLTGKFEPTQLEQLSESIKQANEFRKFLVHSFNACAITRADYVSYEKQFTQLDSLARQMSDIAGHKNVSETDKVQLRTLIKEYAEVSRQLAAK